MKSNAKMCRMYVTRHGETIWNSRQLMQGHKDSPLTANGIMQTKKIKKLLTDVSFTGIFSSDLERAKKTAEILAVNSGLPVYTDTLLRERSFGPFEGKSLDYFWVKLKKSIRKQELLNEDEKLRYKIHSEIESDEEISQRMISFLKKKAVIHKGANLLVVSHGGIIRATLLSLGFATSVELPHGSVSNASYVVIESDGNTLFVRDTYGIQKIS